MLLSTGNHHYNNYLVNPQGPLGQAYGFAVSDLEQNKNKMYSTVNVLHFNNTVVRRHSVVRK